MLNPKESVNAEFQRQDFQSKPEGNEGYIISGPPGTAHQNGEFPTLRRLLKQGGTVTKYTGDLPHPHRQEDLVIAKL